MEKFKVGILGATGMVGRRFVALLNNHPWFEIVLVAASQRSAGKTFQQALLERGVDKTTLENISPRGHQVRQLLVQDVSAIQTIAQQVDLVFCALDLDKRQIAALEEDYARNEVPVISNNSAHRWTPDVPVIIPEVNPQHSSVIARQRQRLGVQRGFIVTKPNCSLQSFVPAIEALRDLQPSQIIVSTYQAVSGAGRVLADWEEMKDNVIPFINGEEEKTEKEPLKIWGSVGNSQIISAASPMISSQCVRVGVSDGHLATVRVKFAKRPQADDILVRWQAASSPLDSLQLPLAPKPFLIYHREPDRPQPVLDRDAGKGMAISIGRLQPDTVFDYKFVCLSHNTIRGAAGGG